MYRLVAIAALVVLVSGCASVSNDYFVRKNIEYPDEFVEPLLPNGMGIVYFYAPEGFGQGSRVWVDGELAALASFGAFTYVLLPAGEHDFTAQVAKRVTIAFDVVAGERHYVKYMTVPSLMNHPSFERVPEVTGSAAITGLKYAKLKEQG